MVQFQEPSACNIADFFECIVAKESINYLLNYLILVGWDGHKVEDNVYQCYNSQQSSGLL